MTRRKTFAILAILLVGTIAAAILECQVHAESSTDEPAAEHEHAAPMGHHHASTGTMGHVACLIAVLPTEVFFVWFTYVWFHVAFRVVCLASPAFPPIIPPRAAVH